MKLPAPLLLLVVVLGSSTVTAQDELEAAQPEFFDLESLTVTFGGVTITTQEAQAVCPIIWTSLLGCLIQNCPSFPEVCPEFGQDPATATTCTAFMSSICTQTVGEECCLDTCRESFLTLTACFEKMGVEEGPELVDTCTGPIDCDAVALLLNSEEFIPPMEDGNFTDYNSTMTNSTSRGKEEEEPSLPLIGFSEDPKFFPFKLYFGPYGIPDMEQHCQAEWGQFLGCIVGGCPLFVSQCSTFAEGPSTKSLQSTCDDLTTDLCHLGDGEDCCLSVCFPQLQAATTCVHKAKSTLDLTKCPEVNCAIEPENNPLVASKTGLNTAEKEEKTKQQQQQSSNTAEMIDNINGNEGLLPGYLSAATTVRDCAILFVTLLVVAVAPSFA